ncbi:Uma2 family endonuclease [Bacillus sp. V59.32b]|uniref:Uma2 family endonuclease n=1 Tax=Bacillus sp. V59.32b TaxID=1758642 RepID=UPI000E3D15F6|nr:Uma2 family endonuclease [Bacillus sp. V59.32b]RFU63616.1 Uma2 family endonuclease [Bacillus sp. V59.32b]
MRTPDESKTHTYKDWLEWDGRWELIYEKAYNMTPAPSSEHQFIVGELFHKLRLFYGNKKCNVVVSPFDVYLSENDDFGNPTHVVQPDISVICNHKQITEKGYYGAPTLIVEVLSPSTALKDYNEKFNIYQRFRVKEYWIVDGTNKIIHVNGLEDGYFSKRITYGRDDTLHSFEFDDLGIVLNTIFE